MKDRKEEGAKKCSYSISLRELWLSGASEEAGGVCGLTEWGETLI